MAWFCLDVDDNCRVKVSLPPHCTWSWMTHTLGMSQIITRLLSSWSPWAGARVPGCYFCCTVLIFCTAACQLEPQSAVLQGGSWNWELGWSWRMKLL